MIHFDIDLFRNPKRDKDESTFEKFCRADDGSRGASRSHEMSYCAICIIPNLRTGAFEMGVGIVRVIELIQDDPSEKKL
jgi:hypothetical protein